MTPSRTRQALDALERIRRRHEGDVTMQGTLAELAMVAGLVADREAECEQWRDWAMEDGWLAPEGAG